MTFLVVTEVPVHVYFKRTMTSITPYHLDSFGYFKREHSCFIMIFLDHQCYIMLDIPPFVISYSYSKIILCELKNAQESTHIFQISRRRFVSNND